MHIVIASEVEESLDVSRNKFAQFSLKTKSAIQIEMSIYRRVLRYYRPFWANDLRIVPVAAGSWPEPAPNQAFKS